MYINIMCPHCGSELVAQVDLNKLATVQICCHGCYAMFLATPVPYETIFKDKNPVIYSFCFMGESSCSILQEM